MSENRLKDIKSAGLKSRNAMAWLRDHQLPSDPMCYTVAYEYLFTENEVLKIEIDKIDFSQDNCREILEKTYQEQIIKKQYEALSMHDGNTNQYVAEILSLLVGTVEQKKDTSAPLLMARQLLSELKVEAVDIEEYTAEMDSQHDQYVKIKDAESKDELTGVLDKNGMLHTIREAIKHPENYPMSILHFDIDQFSLFNKNNGKMMGNAALKHLGKIFTDSFRGSDVVSRVGDDDFILILPKTPVKKGIELADNMRKKIAAMALKKKGSSIAAKMTVSVGVSELEANNFLNDALAKAKIALVRSIDLGRNCVNHEY